MLAGSLVLGAEPRLAQAAPAGDPAVLRPGEALGSGQSMVTSNGWMVTMQDDGNLVVYAPGQLPRWSSATNGNPGAQLEMQEDGNLVVYGPGHVPLWASQTNGKAGAELRMQRDGNLVVYSAHGDPIWASNTAGPARAWEIGTFNMAGGQEDFGKLGDEAPDALIRSVEDRKPAFVTLQEACQDWSERLGDKLSNYRIAFNTVAQSKDGPTARCNHPSDFGNAILFRDDLRIDTFPDAFDLGSSPDYLEQREMLCVEASASRIAICSLHLQAGDEDNVKTSREAEAIRAREILAQTYSDDYTIFVGGDLNAVPRSAATDNFYHSDYGDGAEGELKEVDSPCGNEMKEGFWVSHYSYIACRDGESTTSFGVLEVRFKSLKKIDYLFVSPSVRVERGDATRATHSDHVPLWAEVTF